MANLLDPFGLWRTGFKVVRFAEKQTMAVLRSRLEANAPMASLPAPRAKVVESHESLGGKMNNLLNRALDQSTSTSRTELFHKMLDQLVPDEARILGALSDGSKSPMVNVFALGLSGLKGDLILGNASLIGKTANVSLPAMTPSYVTHLMSLGLLESAPDDPTLKDEFQILLADTQVLRATKKGGRGPLAGKIERFTLKLSPLGRELWDATSGKGQ